MNKAVHNLQICLETLKYFWIPEQFSFEEFEIQISHALFEKRLWENLAMIVNADISTNIINEPSFYVWAILKYFKMVKWKYQMYILFSNLYLKWKVTLSQTFKYLPTFSLQHLCFC